MAATTTKQQHGRMDEILKGMQSHVGVVGVIIIDAKLKSIIKTTMEDQGMAQKYATLCLSVIESTAKAVSENLEGEGSDVQILRIKMKKNEVMIAPDGDFILVVIQNSNDNGLGSAMFTSSVDSSSF